MSRAGGAKQTRTLSDLGSDDLLKIMAARYYDVQKSYLQRGNVDMAQYRKLLRAFNESSSVSRVTKDRLMTSGVEFYKFLTPGSDAILRKQNIRALHQEVLNKFLSPDICKKFLSYREKKAQYGKSKRAATAQVAADGGRADTGGRAVRRRNVAIDVDATGGGVFAGGGAASQELNLEERLARLRGGADVAADSHPVVAAVPRTAIVLDDDGRGDDIDVDAPASEVNSKFVKDALKAINSKKYGSNGIFNSPSVTVKVGFTSAPCDREIVGVSADDPRKKVVDAFNHLVALNEALKSSAPESRGFFARSRQAGDVAIAQEGDIRSNLEAFNVAVKAIGFSEEVNDAVQLGQAAKFLKDKIKSAQFPSAAIQPFEKERVAGFAPSGFPSQAEVSIAVRTGQEK